MVNHHLATTLYEESKNIIKMKLRKLIGRLFWGINFNKHKKNNSDSKKSQISSFERFKNWLHEQNVLKKFAQNISDGTTVYFSDDFAAAYDLRIVGFGEPSNTIVVQLNLETQEYKGLNERFLETSVKTWKELGWEVWYLDCNLQWLIIDNGYSRIFYSKKDLIKSEKINFEFKLGQIP